jgi:hypothetical protein
LRLRDGRSAVELTIQLPKDKSKALFDVLIEMLSEIEAELGYKLDWQRKGDRERSLIIAYPEATGSQPHSEGEQLDWFVETVKKFRDSFNPRIERFFAA